MTKTAFLKTQTLSKTSSKSLQRLRAAARVCFIENGYDNTRPQDIARQAELSSGTFYLHFTDKKSAYLDFAEQAQDELINIYLLRLTGVTGQRERWRVIFHSLIEFGTANPGLLHAAFLDPVLIAPNDEDAWRLYDRLGAFVALALDDGHTYQNKDLDLAMISHAICGAVRQAMTYGQRKNISKSSLIESLSLFIDRGLGMHGLDGRKD